MPNWKSYESSVRLISAILAAHPELKLNYGEIAKYFGGDCTKWAIDNRFRRLKVDAKRFCTAVENGEDPIKVEIDLGSGCVKEIASFYGDCTASSLDHRFRPIKKAAADMRQAIADKYGEGVTAKAVSTRIERGKKEPGWIPADGKQRGRSGKANVKTEAMHSDEDDEENASQTPTLTPKKSGIHKVKNGRVTKSTPKGSKFNNNVALSDNAEAFKVEDAQHFEEVKVDMHDAHGDIYGMENYPQGGIEAEEDGHPFDDACGQAPLQHQDFSDDDEV